jgi:hypothetical protein
MNMSNVKSINLVLVTRVVCSIFVLMPGQQYELLTDYVGDN